MKRISAIVFDLDQTLFDRQRAFDDWIAGLDLSPIDRSRLRLLDQNGYGDRGLFMTAVESITGEAMDHRRFVQCLIRHLRTDHSLIESLNRLQENYRIAILTNGGWWTQHSKIKLLRLGEVFPADRIFVSSQIGFAKPDPNAFKYVSDALGVVGSECLYFGDQWETDILAARVAGWLGRHVQGPADLKKSLRRLTENGTCFSFYPPIYGRVGRSSGRGGIRGKIECSHIRRWPSPAPRGRLSRKRESKVSGIRITEVVAC